MKLKAVKLKAQVNAIQNNTKSSAVPAVSALKKKKKTHVCLATGITGTLSS